MKIEAKKPFKNQLLLDITKHEGLKLDPYEGPAGNITGGFGHLMTEQDYRDFDYDWSDEEKGTYWSDRLKEDISSATSDVFQITQDWEKPPNKEQLEVLIDLRFQLGRAGLQKFTGLLGALSSGDTDKAAEELIDSKLHRDHVKWRGEDEPSLRTRELENKLRNSK